MGNPIRQSTLFAAEDWKKIYQTFRSADFQSYDYETLRKTMVDYIRTYYPEDFNDYIESSEFVALLDLISFMGQSLSFRSDLNYRENFLQTAERRDSVYRMANMLGYSANRNRSASGLLKITSLKTTQSVIDSNGNDLSGRIVNWNDPANFDWQEQFSAILNASLQNAQRIGRPAGSTNIGNIRTDHYEIRTTPNRVPIVNFNSRVNNTSMGFSLYNAAIDKETGIYEKPPIPGNAMGFLFRSDGAGNNSPNTGFFFAFKQGRLNNLDFVVNERLANRVVGVNVNNINNEDVWLYEISDAGGYKDKWQKVDMMVDNNVIYNDIESDDRKLFSIFSRANDQIDLIFGDGVFSDIPVGRFRTIVRTSNGQSYSIVPQEMRDITVDIDYVSSTGKSETLTVTLSLQYTVTNASTRESLDDIKIKAPQSYYVQNRMINGEDYNILPFVRYSDILKVKTVNRTSSGISRYLELRDVTGKFSSTNIFCEDGYVYKDEFVENKQFNWTTAADVQNFIVNTLSAILRNKETINLYYDGFNTRVPPGTQWIRGTAETNNSTGFFALPGEPDSDGRYVPQTLGASSSNNRRFVEPGSLLLLRAPEGYFIDKDRNLTEGTVSTEGQNKEIWTSVLSVESDGTANGNGWLSGKEGPGPVILTENIPTGVELVEIYPVYNTNLPIGFTQDLARKIINSEDFGLRYDIFTRQWTIVTPDNLDLQSSFSTNNAGSETGNRNDASWFVAMIASGTGRYNVYFRQLEYVFGSEIETRFYFDPNTRVYDSRRASVIRDQVRILKGNTVPDSNALLNNDKVMEIYDTIRYSDGFRDDTQIKVTFSDTNSDGIPDNPRIFNDIVREDQNELEKLIFFETYFDFDNFERLRYFDKNRVSVRHGTKTEIEQVGKFANPIGTVFYAWQENNFYELALRENIRTLQSADRFVAKTGRGNIKFQYKHNSSNDRRIDPSPSNLMDMYILTESYDRDYRVWVKSGDNTSPPELPTIVEMSNNYRELQMLKSASDSIAFSPARFKPLFGSKATPELQATFRVIKTDSTRLSNSEIRSKVVNIIDDYFAIENWDFGDTFYFTELASYIHQKMNNDISSIVIVPKLQNKAFGDLFQVTCEPDEIFVSAATVDDVELTDAVTVIGNRIPDRVFGRST